MRHWGPGPVFSCEFVTGSRRAQLYAARSLFVGAMLVGFVAVQYRLGDARAPSLKALADLARVFCDVIIGVQVGLLVLAAPAATAGSICLEERNRGSLDVIMATPLSTFSIVWGKWWGSFRTTLPLVAAAFMIAHVPTWRTYLRWPAPWLVGGLIVVFAAVLTGLGLVLATWIRRLDRAVTAFVVLYILWIVAPLLLSFAFYQRGPDDPSGTVMSMASPFFAVLAPTACAERIGLSDEPWDSSREGASSCLVVGALLATVLFSVVLNSFDARLGRAATRARSLQARVARATSLRDDLRAGSFGGELK
jgi:ABC-type Na+ efflux pump permease subunit